MTPLQSVQRIAACAAAILLCLGVFDQVAAQQLGIPRSPILTISSDRLYAESVAGKAVEDALETASRDLVAENRRIEAELSAEEQDLTTRRPEMEPDQFRELADAFDAKVQDIRRTQEAKARELAQKREAERVAFFQAARPVLVEIMREAGASVVLERSSVFLSANATDVTDRAIVLIDEVLADGLPEPEPDKP